MSEKNQFATQQEAALDGQHPDHAAHQGVDHTAGQRPKSWLWIAVALVLAVAVVLCAFLVSRSGDSTNGTSEADGAVAEAPAADTGGSDDESSSGTVTTTITSTSTANSDGSKRYDHIRVETPGQDGFDDYMIDLVNVFAKEKGDPNFTLYGIMSPRTAKDEDFTCRGEEDNGIDVVICESTAGDRVRLW